MEEQSITFIDERIQRIIDGVIDEGVARKKSLGENEFLVIAFTFIPDYSIVWQDSEGKSAKEKTYHFPIRRYDISSKSHSLKDAILLASEKMDRIRFYLSFIAQFDIAMAGYIFGKSMHFPIQRGVEESDLIQLSHRFDLNNMSNSEINENKIHEIVEKWYDRGTRLHNGVRPGAVLDAAIMNYMRSIHVSNRKQCLTGIWTAIEVLASAYEENVYWLESTNTIKRNPKKEGKERPIDDSIMQLIERYYPESKMNPTEIRWVRNRIIHDYGKYESVEGEKLMELVGTTATSTRKILESIIEEIEQKEEV